MKTKINKIFRSNNKHHYRQTVSTTSDFRFVQPTFFRQMLADSTLDVNVGQFIRLTPLPFPTFGKIKVCNAAKFVPVEQVYPAYAAFMSEKEYTLSDGTLYIPKYLPMVRLSTLMTWLLSNYADSVVYNNSTNASPIDAKPEIANSIFDLKMDLEYFKANTGGYVRTREMPDINGKMQTEEYIIPIDKEIDALLTRLVEAKDNTEAEKVDEDYRSLMKSRGFEVGVNATPKYPTANALNSADYIARVPASEVSTGQNTHSLVCYYLHDRGRAVMKALLGLGIQPSLDDDTAINMLPLMAYYKGYFDRFYPTRLNDWMSTATYRLVKFIEGTDISSNPIVPVSGGAGFLTDYTNYVKAMFNEVSLCYVTNDLDFIAANTRTIANGQSPATYPLTVQQQGTLDSLGTLGNQNIGLQEDQTILPQTITNDTPSQHGSMDVLPNVPTSSPASINKWQLDLLKRMTQYVVKDSIIGNRIQLWMKSHLGEDVYNIVYHETNDCGYSESDITIGDIDSTADTVSQGGDYLGAYAGKGIGQTSLHIHHKANTFGYMIVYTWVQVETSWFQGTDAPLTAKNRFEIAQPEFDALGYEVTPRTMVWTDNGISVGKDTSSSTIQPTISSADGFGYMPRYSGWKYCKNIVNGDFRRPSMRESMQPFYVDRMFIPRHWYWATVNENSTVGIAVNTLPLASSQWQYQDRYPWLSNYNRIFANYSINDAEGVYSVARSNIADNFLIHQVNDITEINCLKPLSESYDVGTQGSQMAVNRS